MPLEIVRNDITKVKADAIVNSANRHPICGGGTEYQIYEAAGREDLLKAREQVGPLDVAGVAVTPAFALDAKYIIHTVGPKWNDGKSGEMLALANCYRNALDKAKELGCQSIAFPLISSGVFRFPKDYAVRIATQTIGEFLQTNEMLVTLVVFDRKAFEVSEDLYSDIQAFIDDNYVQDKYEGVRRYASRRRQGRNVPDEECEDMALQSPQIPAEEPLYCAMKLAEKSSASLDDILAKPGETFCDKLFNLIHEKNLDDVEVYKKANLDRKHFSKIRSNVKYKPTKKTALALAIALHLNMDETKDLLARAELALSPSNRGDLVVSYFIERGMYDIWEINNMLFKFGLPTLGV
ncbi:macro domain-containing protein [uncultured Fibrobacter sp.]|uniref:macro domain-containing protein n=1 Tax=uncultured Fibrobacter sp. TaxID=261512 RepID=UPI0025EC6785|nr:macro domain-containing protein [uncultured Fibrobacter sp.]